MMEIEHRLLPKYKKELNNLIKNIEINSKLISLNYLILNEIYFNLFIDSLDHISLSSKIKNYIQNRNYEMISTLHIEIENIIDDFIHLYNLC